DRDPAALQTELGPAASHIAQIVPELREQLPDLPPLPSLEPEQGRFYLFDGITTFLKRVARIQPLVLALDDLHWADKPSLLLLQFVAREIRASPILLLGTYRDVEIGRQHPLAQTVAALASESHCRRVLLRGLERADV